MKMLKRLSRLLPALFLFAAPVHAASLRLTTTRASWTVPSIGGVHGNLGSFALRPTFRAGTLDAGAVLTLVPSFRLSAQAPEILAAPRSWIAGTLGTLGTLGTSKVADFSPLSATVFDGRRSLASSSSVDLPRSGLEGRALLAALHAKVEHGHKVNEYDESRKYMYGTADNVIVDGKRGIIEVYSQTFVPGTSDQGEDYPEKGDQNGDGWTDKTGINAEHVWPQSFFNKKLPMKSDLHHLMPTFVHPNAMRGHLPFGEVDGKGEYSNEAGAKLGQGMFEPPDAAKGKVARALFYFYTRYYDVHIWSGDFNSRFWDDKLELFLKWNRDHPPDENERRRNDLVQKFQGNRNPFIDDPTLAERIGVAGFRRDLPGLRRPR